MRVSFKASMAINFACGHRCCCVPSKSHASTPRAENMLQKGCKKWACAFSSNINEGKFILRLNEQIGVAYSQLLSKLSTGGFADCQRFIAFYRGGSN